jgi:cytidylate kinase
MGSLGNQVARAAAELLGYRLVWRELINQAAQRAGAPEMALAAMDELGLLNIRASSQSIQNYRKCLEQVVLEEAEQGDVIIVGRAAQAILGGRPGVLNVRIIAPLVVRIERRAIQTDISRESALAQIEASDRNRNRFLRRLFQVKLDDPLLYHLIINTGNLSIGQAARLIAEAAHLTDRTMESQSE